VFFIEGLSKTTKKKNIKADAPAEIRNQHLPNTSPSGTAPPA